MKVLWQEGMDGRKCAECEYQAMPIEVKNGPMEGIWGWLTRCEDCAFKDLTYNENPFKKLIENE